MYDQVVKCQRAGLCLSEHFLIYTVITSIVMFTTHTRTPEQLPLVADVCPSRRRCFYTAVTISHCILGKDVD